MNCIICNQIIKGQGKKYCSRDCYFKSRVGLKWPKRGEKTSKALKGRSTIERGPNISKALKKRYKKINGWLSDSEIKIIEKYFIEGYTNDFISIMKNEFPNKNPFLLKHYVNENIEWFNSFTIKKYIPRKVQKWKIDTWIQFKSDCFKYHYIQIGKMYSMKKGMVLSICKKMNIEVLGSLDSDKKMTNIEKIIFNWLIKNNINFERERCLNPYLKNNKRKYKYRIDFLVNNICLEVHGDYWHVNPRLFYNFDLLSNKQKRNLLNDKEKENWCINNNYRFYIIWELDLINNVEKVLKDFKNFMMSNLIKGDSINEYN